MATATTSTITWDIAQLERHLPDGETCPDGAVYTAHWTASLEENGAAASAYGSVGLGDPDPDSFTPFNELTKNQVIGWVLSTLGEEQVASIEASLKAQIAQEENPTSATGLPW